MLLIVNRVTGSNGTSKHSNANTHMRHGDRLITLNDNPTCGPSCGMLLTGSKEATLTLQLLITTVTSSNVIELSATQSTAQHGTARIGVLFFCQNRVVKFGDCAQLEVDMQPYPPSNLFNVSRCCRRANSRHPAAPVSLT
jgi:hypothetical protein